MGSGLSMANKKCSSQDEGGILSGATVFLHRSPYLARAKSLAGQRRGLTKRAPDVWDSAAFSSIFLASSFSCSQAESTPAHTQVTHTVGQPRAK